MERSLEPDRLEATGQDAVAVLPARRRVIPPAVIGRLVKGDAFARSERLIAGRVLHPSLDSLAELWKLVSRSGSP